MKKVETIETVELTRKDIEIITDALQFQWRKLQDNFEDALLKGEEPKDDFEKRTNIKLLRNGFAELINRKYCGIDA